MGYAMKIFNWKTVLVCLAVVAGVVWFVARPADKAWRQARETGVVRFGTDASFMPFEAILQSGELVGLDVDLARELAGRMNLRAEFVLANADRIYETLQAGQCDAIISALSPDPTRLSDFRYTAPYYDGGLVFVARVAPDAGQWQGRALEGRTLAIETGSDADMRARWLARRTLNLRVLERDTPTEALQAVEAGLADAAITDTATARRYIAAHPALKIGARQTSAPYVLAVRASSPELLRALDAALAQVKADGTLERLIGKWLDK